MDLVISPHGTVRALYSEEIDLAELGRVSITRASHVEPDQQGHWFADLAPINGPVLGPFERRSEAFEEEQSWLTAHWLVHQAELPRSVLFP